MSDHEELLLPIYSRSNLSSFLNHTTPSVSCNYPPKTEGGWRSMGLDSESSFQPYFNLADLWRGFDEWSAYGVGVPITLPCGETIVQYYVPSLSAIQIYWHPAAACSPASILRRSSDESDWSDVSDVRDGSSDFGSDNENTKPLTRKFDQWENLSCLSSERPSSDCSDQSDQQGDLIVEYFERCSPYGRAPFSGKIAELASTCPYLFSLRSDDLSHSSWLSVAWYPIYRIPTGPTMSNLSTCFLTFHCLRTPCFQDLPLQSNEDMESCDPYHSKQEQNQGKWFLDPSSWSIKPDAAVDVPAFGLVSYKLGGAFWASALPSDKQHAASLANSAQLWLKQRGVKHPDYDFFTTRQ